MADNLKHSGYSKSAFWEFVHRSSSLLRLDWDCIRLTLVVRNRTANDIRLLQVSDPSNTVAYFCSLAIRYIATSAVGALIFSLYPTVSLSYYRWSKDCFRVWAWWTYLHLFDVPLCVVPPSLQKWLRHLLTCSTNDSWQICVPLLEANRLVQERALLLKTAVIIQQTLRCLWRDPKGEIEDDIGTMAWYGAFSTRFLA